MTDKETDRSDEAMATYLLTYSLLAYTIHLEYVLTAYVHTYFQREKIFSMISYTLEQNPFWSRI